MSLAELNAAREQLLAEQAEVGAAIWRLMLNRQDIDVQIQNALERARRIEGQLRT